MEGPRYPQTPERRGCALVLGIDLVVILGVLAVAVCGFRRDLTAVTFVLAPVAVTPLLVLPYRVAAPTMVVGAALGGEMAAALYATGQYPRFSSWLIVVELAALALAPRTLHILRLARVPGVPPGREIPGPIGMLLIVLLAPLALVVSFLDAMARHPRVAAVGAALAAAVPALVMGSPWWSIPIVSVFAVALTLLPAAARWTVLRVRSARHRTVAAREEGPLRRVRRGW